MVEKKDSPYRRVEDRSEKDEIKGGKRSDRNEGRAVEGKRDRAKGASERTSPLSRREESASR